MIFQISWPNVVYVNLSHWERIPVVLILLRIWQTKNRDTWPWPKKKWFGVGASMSVGSFELGVRGRAF